VKLLLDEMYPASITEQLRLRGRDDVSLHDPDYRRLEGSPDEEIFMLATVTGRTIVSENVPDYRRLEAAALARGEPTPGLVYTTDRQFPRGEPATVGRLVLALAALLDGREQLHSSCFLAPPPG
jgi:hypothetical protein